MDYAIIGLSMRENRLCLLDIQKIGFIKLCVVKCGYIEGRV